MTNKILVVTVYNSENCGSFLQAYAMQKVLKEWGYDVLFYYRKAKGTSHELKPHIINAFKSIARGNVTSSICTLKRWFTFQKLIKNFKICRITDEVYSEVDTVVLGSDTIWNFKSDYFRSNACVFLGNIFEGKKIFSYAASVANTSEDLFSSVSVDSGGLDFHKYLIRDRHTQDCLKRVGIVESEIVCDPSLLLDIRGYSELMFKPQLSTPYIVLYYFGVIPEELKLCILTFAKSKNLKIVSLLKQRNWCDLSTAVDPREMISYYSYASYVVTNTFHGCAFAINFNIPFAAYDEGKNKVTELLNTYECSEHLFKNATDLERILLMKYDTQSVVAEERTKSMNLLKEALQ